MIIRSHSPVQPVRIADRYLAEAVQIERNMPISTREEAKERALTEYQRWINIASYGGNT